MALIKHAKSNRLVKEAVVLDMGDLGRQAARLLENARAEAAAVLEAARLEAVRLIESADQRGYDQGFDRGLQAGRDQGEHEGRSDALSQWSSRLAQLVQAWTTSLDRWESDRRSLLDEAREDVIRLAFSIASKIVLRIPKTDPALVGDQVAAALALVSRPTAIEIRVHPDDRTLIEQIAPALAREIAGCQHVELRDDAAITRGGCIVATPGGRVDATLETQLERIAEAIVPPASTETNNVIEGE